MENTADFTFGYNAGYSAGYDSGYRNGLEKNLKILSEMLQGNHFQNEQLINEFKKELAEQENEQNQK